MQRRTARQTPPSALLPHPSARTPTHHTHRVHPHGSWQVYERKLAHHIVLSFKFLANSVFQPGPAGRSQPWRLSLRRRSHTLDRGDWCTRGVSLYWKRQSLDALNLLACTGEHTAGGSIHAGLACTGLARLAGQTAEPSAGRQQRWRSAVADAHTASATAAAAVQPGPTPPPGLQLKPFRRSFLHIFNSV